MASPYSPETIQAEATEAKYSANGVDDYQSDLYRDFDRCGRTQHEFQNRANLAGIKNLNTTSFRHESPIRVRE